MHYMIDLETLSTRVDAAIIQIGIAAFTEEKVVKSYKWNIDPEGHVDISTIKWWFGKIEGGAPNPLTDSPTSLQFALLDICSRMKEVETVWAHRSAFDIPILTFAFRAKEVPLPWEYHQVRDTVTFSMLYPDITRVSPSAAHDAEADAIAQAQWMVDIIHRHKGIKH